MSDLAKLIAEDTQDSPYFTLYGFEKWRAIIASLLDAGYSDAVTEALMRSTWVSQERESLVDYLKYQGFLPHD